MKHGQKSEQKSAKNLKKGSPAKAGGKSRPGEKASKPASAKAAKTGAKAPVKKESRSAEPAKRPASSSNGARKSPQRADFSNAAVARAFDRAVKKYPNAFKRLTD